METPKGEGEGEGWSVMYFSSTLLTNRVYIQIFVNTQPSTVPSTSSILPQPQPQPTQQTLHYVILYRFLSTDEYEKMSSYFQILEAPSSGHQSSLQDGIPHWHPFLGIMAQPKQVSGLHFAYPL